jgi:uncharacterized protein YndB with AHSA1/START domain
MQGLFVNQTVEIKADPAAVWTVLTSPEFSQQWATAFTGQPTELVSDWKIGSVVDWQSIPDHKVFVTGSVTACEPEWLLRFTVFDVSVEPPQDVSSNDGITFTLFQHNGSTLLTVAQGDFAKIPDGVIYQRATVANWAKALPRIRELAEGELEKAR